MEDTHWKLIKERALPCLLQAKQKTFGVELETLKTSMDSAIGAFKVARDAYESDPQDPQKAQEYQDASQTAEVSRKAYSKKLEEVKLWSREPSIQMDIIGEHWDLLATKTEAELEAWCDAEEIAREETNIAEQEAAIAAAKTALAKRKGGN